MIKPYFDDLENVLIKYLLSAKHSLKIAVAWISFDIYAPIFMKLLNEGINIKIVIDSNPQNIRQQETIDTLVRYGAKVNIIKYPGCMHHKFCVIDKKMLLFGSFNWTHNANMNNSEDLNYCDDWNVVQGYLLCFKSLCELKAEDIKTLMNPQICKHCGTPIFNILLIEQEGYYHTKADVLRMCQCNREVIKTEYYDISVYLTYQEILHKYSDVEEQAEQFGNQDYKFLLQSEEYYELSDYLSFVRKNNELPIIHAVGVRGYELIGRHTDRYFYKIIWKEQGAGRYIRDEYDMEWLG